MRKKLFIAETCCELKWWAISIVTLTIEYVSFTRYRDLSPSSILMVSYSSAGYTPPSLLESAILFILFLLILITGGIFVYFTKKLVVKFCRWLCH